MWSWRVGSGGNGTETDEWRDRQKDEERGPEEERDARQGKSEGKGDIKEGKKTERTRVEADR